MYIENIMYKYIKFFIWNSSLTDSCISYTVVNKYHLFDWIN
jgi:hypothetical protein